MGKYENDFGTHYGSPLYVSDKPSDGMLEDLGINVYSDLVNYTVDDKFYENIIGWGTVGLANITNQGPWFGTFDAGGGPNAMDNAGTYRGAVAFDITTAAEGVNLIRCGVDGVSDLKTIRRYLNFQAAGTGTAANDRTSNTVFCVSAEKWTGTGSNHYFFGMTELFTPTATRPMTAAGVLSTNNNSIGWNHTEGSDTNPVGRIVLESGAITDMTEYDGGLGTLAETIGASSILPQWFGIKLVSDQTIWFYHGTSPHNMRRVGYIDVSGMGTINDLGYTPSMSIQGGAAPSDGDLQVWRHTSWTTNYFNGTSVLSS